MCAFCAHFVHLFWRNSECGALLELLVDVGSGGSATVQVTSTLVFEFVLHTWSQGEFILFTVTFHANPADI